MCGLEYSFESQVWASFTHADVAAQDSRMSTDKSLSVRFIVDAKVLRRVGAVFELFTTVLSRHLHSGGVMHSKSLSDGPDLGPRPGRSTHPMQPGRSHAVPMLDKARLPSMQTQRVRVGKAYMSTSSVHISK